MERRIVYPGSIPLDLDILGPQQSTMIALGYLLQAAFGSTTLFDGLACVPTNPPSMSVQVGPGSVISLQTLEATDYGSVAADTADTLVKMGINRASTTFSVTAPASAGQSQCYLIQGTFLEQDGSPTVLAYYNSANPAIPFTGPSNSATPQNTVRSESVNLQVKIGAAATTGSQTIPPVDVGWFGLWVITVQTGQSSITSSSIAKFAGAPFIGTKLPGAAAIDSPTFTGTPRAPTPPSSDTSTRIATMASLASLAPTSSLGIYAPLDSPHFTGIPTAPTAAVGTNTSQLATMSALAAALVPFFAKGGSQVIVSNVTFTVPANVTRIFISGVAPGGGGGGPYSNGGSVCTGGGGSSGQLAWRRPFEVTPGQTFTVICPTGGIGGNGQTANGFAAGDGTNGASAAFGGLITLVGGQGGKGGTLVVGLGGASVGNGSAPGGAGLAVTNPTLVDASLSGGVGGCSAFGDYGRGGQGGSGGRANGTSNLANTGLAGGQGLFVVEW